MHAQLTLIMGVVAAISFLAFVAGVAWVTHLRTAPRSQQAIGLMTWWIGVTCACASVVLVAAVLSPAQ